MTAIHGSGAIIYMSPGTGVAVQINEQAEYSIELDADIQDASALGSTWGNSVKGMNKWMGSASGNFDTASILLWSAATATTAQKVYIYPDRTDATKYYYGTAFIKLTKALAGGVAAKATSGFSMTGSGQLAIN